MGLRFLTMTLLGAAVLSQPAVAGETRGFVLDW